MKKFLLLLLLLTTTVFAEKTYLFKESKETFVTNNDNYNYGEYLLEQNQILVVPPENGILSNDIVYSTDYKIHIFESSENSSLEDIEINETTGSFSYCPNESVVGEVVYKYYIEYDGKNTNVSYIYFYVKNTITEYTINYYEKTSNNKIVPSVIKKSNVNKIITINPVKIENYKLINNKSITKKISNISSNNNFDFYYEKIPNTGI